MHAIGLELWLVRTQAVISTLLFKIVAMPHSIIVEKMRGYAQTPLDA
jgi:hypothetical protein